MKGKIRIAGTVGSPLWTAPGSAYCLCRAVRMAVRAATTRRRTTLRGGQDIELDTAAEGYVAAIRSSRV